MKIIEITVPATRPLGNGGMARELWRVQFRMSPDKDEVFAALLSFEHQWRYHSTDEWATSRWWSRTKVSNKPGAQRMNRPTVPREVLDAAWRKWGEQVLLWVSGGNGYVAAYGRTEQLTQGS